MDCVLCCQQRFTTHAFLRSPGCFEIYSEWRNAITLLPSQLRGTIILAELPNSVSIVVISDMWRVELLFISALLSAQFSLYVCIIILSYVLSGWSYQLLSCRVTKIGIRRRLVITAITAATSIITAATAATALNAMTVSNTIVVDLDLLNFMLWTNDDKLFWWNAVSHSWWHEMDNNQFSLNSPDHLSGYL